MRNTRGKERRSVWSYSVAMAALVGVAACTPDGLALPQDKRHSVETMLLSSELESLGGIGGVSVDEEGYIIVANFNRHVWRISPEGEVQVLVDDLVASSGNTVRSDGQLLQSDFEAQTILRISSGGGGTEIFSGEGLDGPVGLAEGPDGEIYVANFSGGYIARVPASGGSAVLFARHDKMTAPNSIVRGPAGDFYVADPRSPILFKISSKGEVTELATLPGEANGHLTLADGALYVTQLADHRVLRVELDGSYVAAAGTGVRGFADSSDGLATISYPNGIATDPSGDFLYFNNHRGVMRSGERGEILLRRLHIAR